VRAGWWWGKKVPQNGGTSLLVRSSGNLELAEMLKTTLKKTLADNLTNKRGGKGASMVGSGHSESAIRKGQKAEFRDG